MTDASNCKYISCDGIAKSCQKEGIPFSCSFVGDLDRFVIGDKKELLLNHPFAFVSGAADTKIPCEFPHAHKLLENPFLRAWWTQNRSIIHPKIHALPVGLDYHSVEEGRAPHWAEKASAVSQEEDLEMIIKASPPLEAREIKGYCNFHLNLGWVPERKLALRLPEQSSLSILNQWIPRKETWRQMSHHAFVLSPWGVGMDCHRTWEALILGCIPIVNMSAMNEMFEGLPVWFVDDWRQVTQETMHSVLEQFRGKTFQWEKLTLAYWMDRIRKSIGREITYARKDG